MWSFNYFANLLNALNCFGNSFLSILLLLKPSFCSRPDFTNEKVKIFSFYGNWFSNVICSGKVANQVGQFLNSLHFVTCSGEFFAFQAVE
uniref:Uncharacterized protein n=1 Tax=Rhizophora mucronata TaxID=61149 RepID=A0A2P2JX05_RHIMU